MNPTRCTGPLVAFLIMNAAVQATPKADSLQIIADPHPVGDRRAISHSSTERFSAR